MQEEAILPSALLSSQRSVAGIRGGDSGSISRSNSVPNFGLQSPRAIAAALEFASLGTGGMIWKIVVAQMSSDCYFLEKGTTWNVVAIDTSNNFTTDQVDAVMSQLMTRFKWILSTLELAARMPIIQPLKIQVQVPDVQAVFGADACQWPETPAADPFFDWA